MVIFHCYVSSPEGNGFNVWPALQFLATGHRWDLREAAKRCHRNHTWKRLDFVWQKYRVEPYRTHHFFFFFKSWKVAKITTLSVSRISNTHYLWGDAKNIFECSEEGRSDGFGPLFPLRSDGFDWEQGTVPHHLLVHDCVPYLNYNFELFMTPFSDKPIEKYDDSQKSFCTGEPTTNTRSLTPKKWEIVRLILILSCGWEALFIAPKNSPRI